MATLTKVSLTGQVLSLDNDGDFESAAGGGDQVVWSKGLFLLVRTGATASQTVTAATVATNVGTPKGVATLASEVLTTVASETAIMYLGNEQFKDSNGFVQLTYSGVTNLEVLAVDATEAWR